MKKVAIGFFIFLALLVAIAAIVPVLFKDKIKLALDKEIAKNINAEVLYETGDVSLSLLRDFPNLSLGVDNLAVIGKDSFQTDTLAVIPSFRMGLNLASVIAGDELKINSIVLNEPVIRLLVLESGKANWDILIEDTTAVTEADTTGADFNMAIKHWEVNDGTIFYEDRSIPFGFVGYNVDHSGSGDFEQNVFDMVSETTAERFAVTYDGVNYLENARLAAAVTMEMNLDEGLYTFKDNNIRINEFPFRFDGTILMPDEAIDFDLTFSALETDFRNVLSVVPGMYSEEFASITTEGKLSFEGYLKGRMIDTLMPGYGVDLKIVDGMFKYPELPEAARNINVDMSVASADGTPANTNVAIREFHMELGKNPVDAQVVIEGLETMKVAGNVQAKINLAEMTQVFSVEGMTLRGLLRVDAEAKGVYSETSMPVIEADLNLTDGYVKSEEFPAPIQNLNMLATVVNTTGNTDDTRVDIKRFNMQLDGEPLEGRALIVGVDKPAFDFKVDGVLDLTKLTKIFPLENTTLAGVIKANVAAKGKLSDIEAEKYQNIQANGTVAVNDLKYVSEDLPNGLRIDKAAATFNSDRVQVQSLSGYLGKSDIRATGTVSNYLGYALADDQPLRGEFNISSNRFDVNEWMVDDEGAPADASTEGVVEVPENLDVTLNIDAKEVVYTDLKLNNVTGQVLVKDKIARLNKVGFNTLGGTFAASGTYNTQDLQRPLFDMKLDVQNLGFKEAFNSFNTVKAFAPIAGVLEGKFSTNFAFAGELGQDMVPVFQTLDGTGVIKVLRAAVRDVPLVNKISSLTNFEELRSFVVENRIIDAEIVDGKLVVKPFEMNVGNIDMTVGGSTSADGGLDYVTALNVPAGKVGKAVTSRLAGILGREDMTEMERVTLKLSVGGTYTDPKVGLVGGSVKEKATDFVRDAVENKLDDARQQVDQRKQQLQDSLQAELNRRKQEAEQKALEALEKKRQEAAQQVKKEAADRVGGFLKQIVKPAPATKPDTAKTGTNQ
ncbi:AsmA-like protein [Pontibacter ummariensis]|uniref:AsmA family protein n=1 Tax=Pontibacter ummariensis TaxID=1610492 RepID=A0A239CIZ6_9BACT|nr:AsmA-like C-terminal region-containing protein [Pontibacter ummariensis]PRY14986.1 AsmA-like protein [Pontibacter ummariensis]SNS20100.1 AsmA family protein [Pontibacter ummariensis]